MPREKENYVLKPTDFEIQGNSIRAFYDKHGKLVFVLDSTINKIKPNVLLVMTSIGNRKWDDILSNDYGMDLELVRPKKDNKYQKLDVEYDGLAVYDDLIRAYQDKQDIKKSLQNLQDFRAMSVRRSATERLTMASAIAENARATIERTGDVIIELQAKIKAARAKLTSLRRGVGREPTKQSASKILKAEAQLDVLTDKLARAKKRLENANKRLLVAEDDIAAARKVLDLVPQVDNKKIKTATSGMVIKKSDVKKQDALLEQDPDDEDDDADDKEINFEADDFEEIDLWGDDDTLDDESADDDATYDENDQDDEIKPLFDKDPNILDEKIAFKPISFNEEPGDTQELNVEKLSETDADVEMVSGAEHKKDEPVMSFEPPKSIMDVVSVPEQYGTDDNDVKLDGIFSDGVQDDIKYDSMPITEKSNETDAVVPDVVDDKQESKNIDSEEISGAVVQEPVVVPESTTEIETKPVVQPVVAPAPYGLNTGTEKLERPVVPGKNPVVSVDSGTENRSHRPNLLYYVLLLVLIALSVFTLWLYHRSNVSNEAVPELNDANAPVVVQQDEKTVKDKTVVDEEKYEENPFVASGSDAKPTGPIIQQVVEESLDKVAAAAGIEAKPEPVETNNQPVAAEQEPVVEETVVPDTDVQTPVDKPEYNVSQDKIVINQDAENSFGGNLCDGDVAPDSNGCCPGETYNANDNLCCPADGGDCFEPLF